MKKSLLICILFILLLNNACKDKDTDPIDCSNIILRNKALDIQKNCLKGKWQMHFSNGGLNDTLIDYQNTYIEFVFNNSNVDSIKWYNDTLMYANGLLTFSNEISKNNDYVYMMEFPYSLGFINYWFATKVENDTLMIEEDFIDGFTHYLTKQK